MNKKNIVGVIVLVSLSIGFVFAKSMAGGRQIQPIGIFGKPKPINITKEDNLSFKKAEELRKAGQDYSEHLEGAQRYISAKCAQRSQAVLSGRPVTMDTWHQQYCGFNNPYMKAMIRKRNE